MEIKNHKTINLSNLQYSKEGFILPKGDIKRLVVCVRPGHKSGIPQIYAEKKTNKIISHNYGHSGVGYSLLFGSVEKSIENFIKIKNETENFENEITVVGMGCMGLVTALKLYHRGYKNIKIIGASMDGPSYDAGGLIEFSLSTIYKKENIEFVNNLFKNTFLEYKNIFEGKHNFIKSGVKLVDYYTDFFQEGAGLSYLINEGIVEKEKKVLLKIGNCDLRELIHFKTFHIVTTTFMNELFESINNIGISVEQRKIKSFEEINSSIIFNCSGLGSYELNNDKDCYPICGHGIILSEENYKDHGYIIRLANVNELQGLKIDGPIYFMPKETGFIGGSYIRDYDGSNEKFNNEIITDLVERSKYIFNEIKPKF